MGATEDGDAGAGGSDVLSHSIGRLKFFIVPPVRNNASASFCSSNKAFTTPPGAATRAEFTPETYKQRREVSCKY